MLAECVLLPANNGNYSQILRIAFVYGVLLLAQDESAGPILKHYRHYTKENLKASKAQRRTGGENFCCIFCVFPVATFLVPDWRR